MQEQAKRDDTPHKISEPATLQQRHCSTCGLELQPFVDVCPQDGTRLNTPISEDRTLKSKYEFIGTIGSGGMGVIYKARQIILNKMVAIKMMHSHLISMEALRRFQIEGQATSLLKHPCIVTVLDFGVTESGQPYMVMDFVEGRTLAAVLKESGRLPLDRFLKIFIQVADALSAAHKSSVLHRDVKPSNIMLVRSGDGQEDVRIMDFGIAKLMDDTESGVSQLTKTGDAIGSPLYMSPEQCRSSKVDQRSDLYSLGCVMYETLTGAPPFIGKSTIDTLMMHLSEEPTPMAQASLGVEINPGAQQVVTRLLQKKPDDRYQSMRELKEDLEALQAETVEGKTLGRFIYAAPEEKVGSNSRRRILILVSIFILFGAGLFLLAKYGLSAHSPNNPQADLQKASTAPGDKDLVIFPLASAGPDESADGEVEDGIKSLVRSNAAVVNLSLLSNMHNFVDTDLRFLSADKKLRELTVKNADITDAGLRYIADAQLTLLNVSATQVNDLQALRKITSLKRLLLGRTPVSHKGVQVAASLPNLQELDLSGTKIDNKDLELLSNCHNLRKLVLSDCPNITAEAIRNLHEKLGTRCNFVYEVKAILDNVTNLMKNGRFEEADGILTQTLNTAYNLNKKLRLMMIRLRGSCQLEMKHYGKAIALFSEGAGMAAGDGDLVQTALNTQCVGLAHERAYLANQQNKAELTKAIQMRQTAAAMYAQIGSDSKSMVNTTLLADDYALNGQPDLAEKLLKDLCLKMDKLGDSHPMEAASCICRLGNLYMESGRIKQAIAYYSKTLPYLDMPQKGSETDMSALQEQVRLRMARCYVILHQLDQAKALINEGLSKKCSDPVRKSYYLSLLAIAKMQHDIPAIQHYAAAVGVMDAKDQQELDKILNVHKK